MLRYIIKKIAYSLLTLWLLVTLTFFLMHLLPGDPFIGDRSITEGARMELYARYGLDRPLHVQYAKYMLNLLQGDLGDSLEYQNRPVSAMIAQAFPYSLDLGVRALIFAFIAGVLLGTIAAVYRGKKPDAAVMTIAVIGVSVPCFIIGALLQYFIAFKLSQTTEALFGVKLFHVGGWASFSYKILPPFALGLGSVAVVARLMRASMLDVLGQDYIKTAKAKGLPARTVILKHAMRNALLPVITVLGPIAAAMFTGSFVVENIFSIPGMGMFLVQSIRANDYPMIAGTTLFYGAFLIAANMLVDMAYGIADPRIRMSGGKISGGKISGGKDSFL